MAKENAERGASGTDDDEPAEKKSKKIELSATQVTGGALASVTAAFLGSYLGVAGTVFGAGLTSVVITVGGALYQRSLETTKEKLEVTKDRANVVVARAAIKKTTKVDRPLPVAPVSRPAEEATRRIQASGMHWPGGEQVDRDPDATRRLDPAEARTRMLSWGTTAENPTAGNPTAENTAAANPTAGPAEAGTEVVAPPRGSRLRWGVVAATSVLIFGLGMLLITGFEGIVGKPLSGGDGGTTISKVFTPAGNRDTGDAAPQEPESAAPSSSSPRETGSESQENTSGEPTSGASETTETGQSEATEPARETGASEAPEPTGARQPESGPSGERGSAGGESAQPEQPDAP